MSTPRPHRRSVVTAAWAVTAVVAATASPAFASSTAVPKFSYRLDRAGIDMLADHNLVGEIRVDLYLSDAPHLGAITIGGLLMPVGKGTVVQGGTQQVLPGPFQPSETPIHSWTVKVAQGDNIPPRYGNITVSPAGRPSFVVALPFLFEDVPPSSSGAFVSWNDVVDVPLTVTNHGTRTSRFERYIDVQVPSANVQSIELVDDTGASTSATPYAVSGHLGAQLVTYAPIEPGASARVRARLRLKPATTNGFQTTLKVHSEASDWNTANDRVELSVTVWPKIG